MTIPSDKDHRAIYEKWHRAIVAQDLDALMELYDEDATIDSTAVLVLERDPSGILKGKAKLRAHFRAFFDLVGKPKGDWYRLPTVGSQSNTLMWEYPSASPAGEQLDPVEYHRVY
jgi:steroid Delta-isomerase